MRVLLSLLTCIIIGQASSSQNLRSQLDSIYTEDQKYRLQLKEIEKQHGVNSKEIQDQWKILGTKDSVNLLKIKAILDQHGWPATSATGKKGSKTIFLVIQHADLATQVKYLPVMREAVKDGKVSPDELALLEDRIAIRQGKRQIYGSQVGRDPDTNQYYVQPLDDPDNVDKRRAQVGLEPLAKYVKLWNLKWNVEQYKKDLPTIEAKEKLRRK